MNYANIKYCDIANGPGVRTSLFVSGCRLHCKGCFNEVAWDFAAGAPLDDAVADQILQSLRPSYVHGITVLGGEPMEPENQAGLLPLLRRVRAEVPGKTVWVFSGYTYDVIRWGTRHVQETDELLSLVDVLVDGPFMADRHDVSLRFRGSSNQRLIDVAATRVREREAVDRGDDPRAITPVGWEDDPVFATHTM